MCQVRSMRSPQWCSRCRCLVQPRIPIELHHKSYQGTPVAYGTFDLPDAGALLTVVESPGKPMSADLRISPKQVPQRPSRKHKRSGKKQRVTAKLTAKPVDNYGQ